MIEQTITHLISVYRSPAALLAALPHVFQAEMALSDAVAVEVVRADDAERERRLFALIVPMVEAAYDDIRNRLGPRLLREIERQAMLVAMRDQWRRYLEDVDFLFERYAAATDFASEGLIAYESACDVRYADLLSRAQHEALGYVMHVEAPAESDG